MGAMLGGWITLVAGAFSSDPQNGARLLTVNTTIYGN